MRLTIPAWQLWLGDTCALWGGGPVTGVAANPLDATRIDISTGATVSGVDAPVFTCRRDTLLVVDRGQ